MSSSRKIILPKLVHVGSGVSCLGGSLIDPYSNDRDTGMLEVYISEFFAAQYPITNEEYLAYICDTGLRPPRHWDLKSPDSHPHIDESIRDHPVVFISWFDAYRYTKWLSEISGHDFSLPTEAEWEKAARGPEGRIWPWGNSFDSEACNSSETGIGTTCSVRSMERGASAYGCMHMVGNAWEWCLDYYDPSGHARTYPINPVNAVISGQRVVKGGSYYYDKSICRCAGRDYTNSINEGGGDDGFRVILRNRNPKGCPLKID